MFAKSKLVEIVFALKLLIVKLKAFPMVVKKLLVVKTLLIMRVLKTEEVALIVLAFRVFVFISCEMTVLAGRRVVLLIRMVLNPAFILMRVLMFAVLITMLGARNVPSISKSTWGLLPTPKLRPIRFVSAST